MIAYSANLQHGKGTDDAFGFQRQIDHLDDADLIAVQEKGTTETGWNTPLANAGFAEAVYRENDPSTADGNAIWYKTSTVQILQTYQTDLSQGAVSPWDGVPTNVDKSAVGAKVLISGRQFYFVSTHLAWSAGADSDGSPFSAIRVAQIETLLSWVDNNMTGLDRLLLGDMNFGPDYPKNPSGLQIDLFSNYIDLWTVGRNDGKATAVWGDRNSDGTPDMPITDLTTRTHDTRRIDYCFLSKNPQTLAFQSLDIPDLRETCPHGLIAGGAFPACTPEVVNLWDTPDDFGVRPSDHNWLKLTMGFQGARKKLIATAC